VSNKKEGVKEIQLFLSKVPSISTDELQGLIKKRPQIIDVRETDEYSKEHIPIAKNIPLHKLANYSGKQEQEMYVICQSGMRSKQATKLLRKMGYSAINIKGGMNHWSGPVKGGK